MTLFPDTPAVKILTVAELTRTIKGLLEDAFPSVWVSGEISNYRPASSGHIYFTLKDAEAQMPAVIWRGVGIRLRFQPHDGLEVIARGRVDVYPPHGKYQLVVEELQPKGLGALELAFRQLREQLFQRGYFAPERKKPLPRFPRRVVLVTSPTGAAVRDMLEILLRRWPAVEIWICPVRVQGDGAADEIAAALKLLNGLSDIDVIVVGRGGGSLEDLWAFNELAVAEAVFASRIPIVSGVGHETDLTICDLVADLRAHTPSDAAVRIVPDRQEILAHLQNRAGRLRTMLQRLLDRSRQRVEGTAQLRCFRMPYELLREREQKIDDFADRIERAMKHRLDAAGQRLQGQTARLETLSPLNVLARGYSLSRREEDQAVIRSPEQVRPGDRLVTDVQHGRIISRVEEAGQTTP